MCSIRLVLLATSPLAQATGHAHASYTCMKGCNKRSNPRSPSQAHMTSAGRLTLAVARGGAKQAPIWRPVQAPDDAGMCLDAAYAPEGCRDGCWPLCFPACAALLLPLKQRHRAVPAGRSQEAAVRREGQLGDCSGQRKVEWGGQEAQQSVSVQAAARIGT